MEILSHRNLKSHHWKRAGLIPYVIQDGKLLFGFAIDANYHGLTDFGGHRDSEDISILQTIMREVEEETYGAFDFISENDLLSSLSFEGPNGTLEVLVLVEENPLEINDRLMKNLEINQKQGEKLESIGITWISGDSFLELLRLSKETGNKIMYYNVLSPLRNLLNYL